MSEQPPDWQTAVPATPAIHQNPGTDLTRPLTQQQLREFGQNLIEQFLKKVLLALFGSFVPGGGSAFDQLSDAFEDLQDRIEDIPGLGDVLEAFLGREDGDLDDLGSMALKLRKLLGSLVNGRPTIDAVTDEVANLAPAPTFAVGSFTPAGGWDLDPLKSRTSDGTGAAEVTFNGSDQAMWVGENPSDRIATAAGDVITASIFCRHEDYAGTGSPIQLRLIPYTGAVAGAPVLLDTYNPTTPDLAWPGHELEGTYEVPAGVTEVQGPGVYITSGAASGTGYFDDMIVGLTSKTRRNLDSLPQRIQLTIDTILSALTKGSVVGGTLEQLFERLGLIPSDSVTGAAGPANMLESFFALIDSIIGGATGQPGATGGSLANLTDVVNQLASGSAQGKFAWQLANVLNNTPVAKGYLPAGRANYDIASANTFLATTQAASLSASFGLQQSMPIGAIEWIGYGTTGIDEFYVNLRKVNMTTGVRELVFHSDNIVGDLQPGSTAANAAFESCVVPAPLPGKNTDYYWVEWVVVGSGTHHIKGMSHTDAIPDHPTAPVPCVATTVTYADADNPAATLPKPTSTPNLGWVEFAPSLGATPDHREPEVYSLDNDGESIPIPSWCNRVDLVPLSRGGRGADGAVFGFAGFPGQPGKFNPITLVRGVDWTGNANVTFNVLSDGDAKLSIPGRETIAQAGEDGEGTKFGLKPTANGPGIFEYNGQKYIGGGEQKVAGAAGTNPGGGGNGGGGGFFQDGGPGGNPVGWVCFRQEEVPDENPTGDITPPTAPTNITLISATQSSLRLKATGGTD